MEDQCPGQIDERVADGRHFPIDDCEQLRRRLRCEQHVVELVVTVTQRAGLVGRPVCSEPLADVMCGR
jgi:hypothetical protein